MGAWHARPALRSRGSLSACSPLTPKRPIGRSHHRLLPRLRTRVRRLKGATSGCCASEALLSESYRPVSTVVVNPNNRKEENGRCDETTTAFGTPRTREHAIPVEPALQHLGTDSMKRPGHLLWPSWIVHVPGMINRR